MPNNSKTMKLDTPHHAFLDSTISFSTAWSIALLILAVLLQVVSGLVAPVLIPLTTDSDMIAFVIEHVVTCNTAFAIVCLIWALLTVSLQYMDIDVV